MSWTAQIRARAGSLEVDVELSGGCAPVALIGPNGSGKTTILRILAGAHAVQQARIEVDGDVLCDSQRGVSLPIELRGVGYVPQGYGLFPHLTVLDNVAFGLSVGAGALSRTARLDRSHQMLRELDCAHLAARHPARLSGGEQQRVALARALVAEPRFLLLDEPLAALDISARRSVREFLATHLRAWGRPSLVVTHDARDAVELDAAVWVLEAGRVAQSGEWRQVRDEPATEFVREFFGVAVADR